MKTLKILFIGNSFAVDTTHFAAEAARSLGIDQVRIGTLYIGGCSLDMHYQNLLADADAYTFYTNSGQGWSSEENVRISDAIGRDDWDWIAIQHGTHNGARYTDPKCYENLPPLIERVKALAGGKAKIAFNLTWIGEPTYDHHEIAAFGGNTAAMRKRLEEVTRAVVLGNPLIDLLIPTGTAIENARTSKIGLLTRDGYHLSLDKGRYIAALTLVGATTGIEIENISWYPDGVDEYAKNVAIESATNAINRPLTITKSEF